MAIVLAEEELFLEQKQMHKVGKVLLVEEFHLAHLLKRVLLLFI